MKLFSTREQLQEIADALCSYMRLPLSPDTIPGGYVERLVGHVHSGTVLGKYDFVDVVNETEKVGWQVKSTCL